METREAHLPYDEDQDVVNVKPLEVGDNLTLAIGRAHTLESAVSDIIDNSISHAASSVKVSFLEEEGRVAKIRIRDNGSGMDAETLGNAMRMNPSDRKYSKADLGMFGQGMKASSMSQARELSVFTSPEDGKFFGTRLLRADAGGGLNYGELSAGSSQIGFIGLESEISTGTVIEWSQLENVNLARKREVRDEWLTDVLTKLRLHLGLVFHRYLERGEIRIILERFDLNRGRPGAPLFVKPIDPFGFEHSGHEDFPRSLRGRIPNVGMLEIECHIIPPGSRSEAALLMGQDRQKAQGLYVYWRDRLVHFGDWGSLSTTKKEYQLARARIDLNENVLRVVRLNPEKAQLVFQPEFLRAAHNATDFEERYSFETFLGAAQEVLKASNTRTSSLKPVTRVKSGLPETVLETIEATVGWRAQRHSLTFEWGFLPNEQLFDFDSVSRVIRLNSRHREFLSATESNRHEDAPIVRTLLFLLLEGYFSGAHMRKSTEDQIQALGDIVSAALRVQLAEMVEDDRLVEREREQFPPLLEDSTESATSENQGGSRLSPEGEVRRQALLENQESTANITEPIFIETGAEREPAETETEASPVISSGGGAVPTPRPRPFSTPQSRSSEQIAVPSAGRVVEILKQYRRGVPIIQIAGEVGEEEGAIVSALSLALFGDGASDNDKDYAARHGVAWDPAERAKASLLFHQGVTVPQIAAKLNRTPLSVSWQLLDGPKPVPVADSLIKKYQRATKRDSV